MAKSKQTQDKDKDAEVKINIIKTGADSEADKTAADKSAVKKTAADKSSKKADDELAAALKAANDNLAAEKDKLLRLAAEYDNFRKRTAKERDMIYSNAKADVVEKLLPVYDNLERALKQECSDEAFYKGIEMTMFQLSEIFKNIGIEPIKAAGEPFDPNLHDAVMRIEDPNLGEGIIAEECQKGFALGERIIRHSTVVVAN